MFSFATISLMIGLEDWVLQWSSHWLRVSVR